jgi:hypothetical protein
MSSEEKLKYPIGKFNWEGSATDAARQLFIEQIEQAPARLRAAVLQLNPEQLDTHYRPGGWTVRQVVHHLPDSHLNSYVRFKLALTEHSPTIKPYNEARWAELPDSWATPVEVSLALLENLHRRWVVLLKAIAPADWSRLVVHPDRGPMALDQMLALYAWHGQHHVAHITTLGRRMGWNNSNA